MDNLDEFHAFWGTTVPANSSKKVTIPKGISAALSNAALSVKDDTPEKGGRTVLYCQVNSEPEIALFPFVIGRFESTNADLIFTEEDVITFRVKGDMPIDICGTLNGGFSVKIE
jgi:hypothetical protein